MTLEELLAALAKLPEGSKLAEALKAIIAAKDGEITQKGNQHKALSKILKDTEDKLKKSTERLTKLLDYVGIDEDVEDIDAALAEAAKNNKKGGDEALLKRIEKLEKERKKEKAESEALLATERRKRHDAMKNQEILAALTAGKAIKPEKLVALLTNAVKVNDDDSMVFVDDKGNEVKVIDGVTAWLKANPEFVSNSQNSGGGSGGGGNTGGAVGEFGKQLAQESGKAAESQIKAQDQYFK